MFTITHDLPPRLTANHWAALDLELFDADKDKLHRVTGKFASLAICYSPDVVHVLTKKEDVSAALTMIDDAVWVFYNAMFDVFQLRRWAHIPPRKKLWDVMIMERIMCGGLYEGDAFGLEDVVRRRLDVLMDKSVRKTYEGATELTPEQIQYNAEDAYYTLLACEHQKKTCDKNDYKIWTDVDRPAKWAFLDFEGFRIDEIAWMNLARENATKAEEIKSSLSFNPASWQQVKKYLIAGGFKGLKNTENETLQAAIAKYPKAPAVEPAQKVLEYRKYAKRASTYGENFLTRHSEHEGDNIYTIHSSYWVVGAETGRTSSSKPDMQNIPIRDTPEYRKCFIARPGCKLVIADMGQQEARNLAYVSQDKKLIAVFQDTSQDVFVNMCYLIYKKQIEKSDPFRKQVKNTVYGISYGITPDGMARQYGMDIDEAERAIKDFFNTFPDVYNWIERQKRLTTDYITTVMGRKIWINPYSTQAERNRINGVMQGTAADQMKIALGNIYAGWRDEFGINLLPCCVGYIHDEVIFDPLEKYAEQCAEYVKHHMIKAAEDMCEGIPFTVDYSIGSSWADKK